MPLFRPKSPRQHHHHHYHLNHLRVLKFVLMVTVLVGVLHSIWIVWTTTFSSTTTTPQQRARQPRNTQQQQQRQHFSLNLLWGFLVEKKQKFSCQSRTSSSSSIYKNISYEQRRATLDADNNNNKKNHNSRQEQYRSFLVPAQPDLTAPVRVRQSGAPACAVTSQVRIIQSKPYWTLQALDQDGKEKTIGGDEYYITYSTTTTSAAAKAASDDCMERKFKKPWDWTREPTAVAMIQDHNDGTYTLDFASTPMRTKMAQEQQSSSSSFSSIQIVMSNWEEQQMTTGILTVHFVYSCGIGRLNHPAKFRWKHMGVTGVKHAVTGMDEGPPIRPFQRPSSGTTTTDVELTKHNDHIIFFGDSLMLQFVKHANQSLFRPFRTSIRDNIQLALLPTTVEFFLGKLHEWHGSVLQTYPKRLGLVLGSAVWDLLDRNHDPGFQQHLAACETFITEIQNQYPHVNIYWKSPTAMHPHRLDFAECLREYEPWEDKTCKERTLYMSESRSRILYKKQKELMQKLKIPLLDIYDATYLSASLSIPSDGRHFQEPLNELMFSWFYPRPRETLQQYLKG